MLRSYQREWLRADIVAGFVLAALLLPQGMAYAQLAGMPPVTGIYATMVPMVVYALVGPSRILVVGPDSAVGPLVAAALLSMASNPAHSAELGSLLALLVGGVCVVGGLVASGISDRTALEAGARWLHERACADHPREPDPEAARLFNPSAHAARRASSHNRRHRPGEPDQPGHRRGRANSHPRHPPRQTETSRHPGGGRALDISRIATRPLRPRGRSASERSTNAFRAGSGRT